MVNQKPVLERQQALSSNNCGVHRCACPTRMRYLSSSPVFPSKLTVLSLLLNYHLALKRALLFGIICLLIEHKKTSVRNALAQR